ncbi:MAG: transcriptional regulator [Bryobacteraceae bacterium]
MRFLYELFFPLALFLALRAIIRQFMGGYRASRNSPSTASRASSVATVGELKKDPVCGTYVSTTGSLTQMVNGSTVYFCSQECRDKYLARPPAR